MYMFINPQYLVHWTRDEQGRTVEARLRVEGPALADFIRTLTFNQVQSITITLQPPGGEAAGNQTIYND